MAGLVLKCLPHNNNTHHNNRNHRAQTSPLPLLLLSQLPSPGSMAAHNTQNIRHSLITNTGNQKGKPHTHHITMRTHNTRTHNTKSKCTPSTKNSLTHNTRDKCTHNTNNNNNQRTQDSNNLCNKPSHNTKTWRTVRGP